MNSWPMAIVTFRNGEKLPIKIDRPLPDMWLLWSQRGFIAGQIWCAQFDDVAHIEMANGSPVLVPETEMEPARAPQHAPPEPPEAMTSQDARKTAIMAAAIKRGDWKPST